MFKTSHLEALSAVCESGSFEIAASTLGITQSALSQQIGALEREAGLVLVERPGVRGAGQGHPGA